MLNLCKQLTDQQSQAIERYQQNMGLSIEAYSELQAIIQLALMAEILLLLRGSTTLTIGCFYIHQGKIPKIFPGSLFCLFKLVCQRWLSN
ncbi:hypothetical protein FGO68_gene8481 [Halteria grandinella]|uniref:Uncharacterized protein n=1 Tax=Halteria grandinella TaxID=5974 RepID=A0A8J8SZ67_HALGN|nr:hypothetical protein FGO68_gene8481 [Halteria grandinella]